MTHEVLTEQIRQIERKQIPDDARPAFLAMLRARPDDLEGSRTVKWTRGNIYFHALQDLRFGTMTGALREGLQGCQSCFVRDLDQYLEDLPPQAGRIHQLFQTIFEVGTSFAWEDDIPAVERLHDLFQRADEEIIRPWVNQASS